MTHQHTFCTTQEARTLCTAINRRLRKDPAFVGGHWLRVVQHLPGWNIYTDGVNDVHIETALRRIAADLGLMS